MASNTCKKRALQTESDDDLEQTPNFVFKGNETFARFLVIKSMEEKAVTSLSPFIIEKQIESIIGSPKSVKKLKNKTLLVETNRKSQTENLLKTTTFFGLRVSVTEHQSLNSSKGIIRDRMLKGEKEDEIVDYLKEQGVTACKRFKIKKDHETVETNTLLLTFNTVNVPKSLRIFYRIVPVDIYVPNPLRCFNCQRFGHHENNCPVDLGSVCANCGAGGHDHHTSACKNAPKCVNCGKDHVSRSSNCEIWKKEKEICKIKVTKNITYLEAKKQFESQTSDLDFTKIVQSLSSKPESKTVGTQFFENDFTIHPSSKVITPSVKPKSQPKPNLILHLNLSLVLSLNQILGPGPVLLVLSLARNPVQSLVLSLILSLVLSQVLSQTLNRVRRKTILDLRLGEILVGDRTLVEVRPPINRERDLTIPSKW